MAEGRDRQMWDHTASLMWIGSHSRHATPSTFHPFAESNTGLQLLEPGQAAVLKPRGVKVRTIKAQPKDHQHGSQQCDPSR